MGSRPAAGESVVVAVDANGADMGPAEVAAGVRIAAEQGIHVLVFGPSEELSEALSPLPLYVEVVDAPVSIAKSPDPTQPQKFEYWVMSEHTHLYAKVYASVGEQVEQDLGSVVK